MDNRIHRALTVLLTLTATCAVLVAPLAAAPPGAQAPPIFDVSVETVYLDVSVTDHHGEPVAGLTAADFEVRDNGVLQDPRLVDRGTVAATQRDRLVEQRQSVAHGPVVPAQPPPI